MHFTETTVERFNQIGNMVNSDSENRLNPQQELFNEGKNLQWLVYNIYNIYSWKNEK